MYAQLEAKSREPGHIIKPHRLRKAGEVPVVVYSKTIGSISLKSNERALRKCLKTGSHIIELTVVGGEKHLVNIREIQSDPLNGAIIHVAFHALRMDEETKIMVPLKLSGTAPGVKQGGVVIHVVHEIEVEGLPKNIPNTLELDISGLELNHHMSLKDVKLPTGIKLTTEDLEQTVVTCHVPKVEEAPAPAAPAEGEAAAAAGAEGAAAAAPGAAGAAPAKGGEAAAAKPAGGKKEKE